MLSSKILTEIIEKHSDFSGYVKKCNTFFEFDLITPWNYLWHLYEMAPPTPLHPFSKGRGKCLHHAPDHRRPWLWKIFSNLVSMVIPNFSIQAPGWTKQSCYDFLCSFNIWFARNGSFSTQCCQTLFCQNCYVKSLSVSRPQTTEKIESMKFFSTFWNMVEKKNRKLPKWFSSKTSNVERAKFVCSGRFFTALFIESLWCHTCTNFMALQYQFLGHQSKSGDIVRDKTQHVCQMLMSFALIQSIVRMNACEALVKNSHRVWQWKACR